MYYRFDVSHKALMKWHAEKEDLIHLLKKTIQMEVSILWMIQIIWLELDMKIMLITIFTRTPKIVWIINNNSTGPEYENDINQSNAWNVDESDQAAFQSAVGCI